MPTTRSQMRRRAAAAGPKTDDSDAASPVATKIQPKAANSGTSTSSRLDALDGLRSIAALMIAAFHGICWVVIIIRDQERHAMYGSWVGASMYVVVDLFLALTGFLAMRSAISSRMRGRAGIPSVCAWMGLDLGSMRGKFWRLMPPYVATMIAAMLLFAGDKTWPSMYTRSEWSQRIGQLFGPGNDWQGTALNSAGANLLHLNSLVPYAGFLLHTWSLAIQYVWLLIVPSGLLASHAAKPTANGALSVALWSTLATIIMRGVMWAKLNTFGGATDLSGYVHFSFYCALGARFLPLMLGASIAILLADTEGWKTVRARLVGDTWQGWAVRSSLLFCCLGTFAGNTFWEYIYGHPEEHSGMHQLLFYVIVKPGGVATSLVFAWLVFVAVGNLPLLLPTSPGADSTTSQTWFVAALSHSVWKQPSRASYWLYLVHPVVFAATFAVPHLLMPASQLRVPVPLGYGLAIPRAALALENASHPLSPWSCPSVGATCNATAQKAFLPREQVHWLLQHATDTGLVQADTLTGVQLAVSAWGSIVIGLIISFLLAYGLEALMERPMSAWLKSTWKAYPGVAGVVDWMVDWYNAWLFVTLPLCHLAMHFVWMFAIDATQETNILNNLKAGIANSSQIAMNERMTQELHAWGARVATA